MLTAVVIINALAVVLIMALTSALAETSLDKTVADKLLEKQRPIRRFTTPPPRR